ncbi:hypothetical protein [Armatimonas sp.]|uniref:hypothetical protein n=1 Tax=Armatimonas sp. TaxID=1872638 RepID=UPI00374CC17B
MSASEVSIPSAILDRWMPKLKDTELRVLLLVARQTIGRSGKEVDWLAHSQLRKRTGRASEAVSAAVDSLIQKGLLEVVTLTGERLPTPEARRFHRGILLYRLSSMVDKADRAVDKSKTTEYIYSSLRSLRFPKTEGGQEEVGSTRSEDTEHTERAKQQIRERLQGLKPPTSRARRER